MGWNSNSVVTDKYGHHWWGRTHPKPGRGIRLGIRRRKERERAAAEKTRLEAQARQHWKEQLKFETQVAGVRARDQPSPRAVAPKKPSIPKMTPVGMKLYLVLRRGEILLDDPVEISQHFAITQAMRELDIVIPLDHHFSTFGALYDWAKQEYAANQDPNWQSLRREMTRLGWTGTARRGDAMLWQQMRYFICTWAQRQHGVNLWDSQFSGLLTYADAIDEVLLAKDRLRQMEREALALEEALYGV